MVVFLSKAVFAQDAEEKAGWVFSGEIQVFSDLIHYTKASGQIENNNDDDIQKWGDNIDGSLTVFNSSIGPAPDFWSAVYINYFGENIEFGIQVALVHFFRRGPGDGALLTGANVKWMDVLNAGFNEWYLKGRAGIFDGYVGNTGYEGFVPFYDNYTDWVNFKLEDFYVNKMGDHQKANNMDLWGGGSAFAAGVTFADSFRLALGTDFGFGGEDIANGSFSYRNPFGSANAFNLGAMFSGKDIAGLVNFDVFYGIFGSDSNTNARGKYAGGDLDVAPGGRYKNIFGAYGSVSTGVFGISLGYSGELTIYEKQEYNKSGNPAAVDYQPFDLISPLWSSVHIHANFTGIENLNLTFNNNISFAGVTSSEIPAGTNYDKIILGLADGGLSSANLYKTFASDSFTGTNKGETESWFGYDAALQANYKISPAFDLCLQVVNQLGIYTFSKDNFKSSRSSNNLFAVLNAQYNIGNVTVGAGLSFGLETTTYNADSIIKSANNIFTFGIPIVFKVAF